MPTKTLRRVLRRSPTPFAGARRPPRKVPARAWLAAGLMAVTASPTIAKSKPRAAHGPGHGHAHAAGTRGHGHGQAAGGGADAGLSTLAWRADRTVPIRTSFALDAPTAALARRLSGLAPQASPQVVSMALAARSCAMRRGLVSETGTRLGVIDYSLPSTVPRLWVFDTTSTERPRLMFSEVVAHGRGSGEILPVSFSNRDGSFQSSLGLYATAETYEGHNGYSLRLDGLEPGFNDQARNRSIVMHGAWYAEPSMIASQGRLGRSQGCPAVRPEVAHPLIDAMANRQMLFVYSPDPEWMARSALLNCDSLEVGTRGRPMANRQPQPIKAPAAPSAGQLRASANPGRYPVTLLAEAARPPETRARSGRRNS